MHYTVGDGDIIRMGDYDLMCSHILPQPHGLGVVIPADFGMKVFAQNATLWAGLEYAPGFTFRRYGCLGCAYAMIASRAYYDVEPPGFMAALTRIGAIHGGYIDRPSRIPKAYDKLEWGGVIHWRDKPADIEFLRRELLLHGPVVVEIAYHPERPVLPKNQHFLMLLAVSDNSATVVDPIGGGVGELVGGRYTLPGWTPARAITGCRLLRVAN